MSAQLDAEFRDFMHGRWLAMVRLAYALTGDQGHAEDVAQAAFGRVIKWRRRSVAVAAVAAVVAAGAVAGPSLRHAATSNPATSRYTVTVQSPGLDAPPGLIASGTVNGRRWRLTAGKPGAGGQAAASSSS